MTFLILGSNSFTGGSFINYLLDNTSAKIIAISRSAEYDKPLLAYNNNARYAEVEFYQLDLNDDLNAIVHLIEETHVDYIINYAAQGMVAESWKSPTEWFQTNTLSLVGLLDKIHKFSFIKKFVQISTPEVYGTCDGVKESMSFSPSSPYAASKASADLILNAYHVTHNFPVNYTRASNVYGPYQQLYRIIPKTILSIKKGVKLPLHGGGKAIRSFIHIDDVSESTFKIATEAKSGEIYHLSDDQAVSIFNLVKIISEELKVDLYDYVNITEDRVGQDSLYLMNGEKLSDDFELKPKIKLKEGIRTVIDWINHNYDDLTHYPDYYIHKQ